MKLIIISLLFSYTFLFAWGALGHNIINENAIKCLPEPLKEFYLSYKSIIIDESIKPDIWKGDDYENEAPRHYFEVDRYRKYNILFPASYNYVKEILGPELSDAGVLPWRIFEFQNKLKHLFKQKKARKAIYMSAWLGHYIGDGAVPFHTTENYDGQLTGNNGIHRTFETTLLEKYYTKIKITHRKAYKIRNFQKQIFNHLENSYKYVSFILNIDNKARNAAKEISKLHPYFHDDEYHRYLFENVKFILEERLSTASLLLASCWLTAYKNASSPKLIENTNTEMSDFYKYKSDMFTDFFKSYFFMILYYIAILSITIYLIRN